jgi:hypothetical protein
MPSFTVTVRSLALAGPGFGALPALVQSASVTAFNPSNGVGAYTSSGSGSGSERVDVLGP